ncbi:Uncharacterised protein [uncultured archaeon]|nr:Uncharacterised protein [uncultured archaeon]
MVDDTINSLPLSSRSKEIEDLLNESIKKDPALYDLIKKTADIAANTAPRFPVNQSIGIKFAKQATTHSISLNPMIEEDNAST